MDEIKVDSHVLLIDRDATFQYHDMFNERCGCSYCRNFFTGFAIHYPKTVQLLKSFGIDIEYPLEIMEFGYVRDKINLLYSAHYAVKGMLPPEKVEFIRDGATIICNSRANAVYSNTAMSDPCFIVEIQNLYLPWLLNEPYPS